MKKRDRGLTPKQARFVEEYLIDLNGTAAYIRAFGATNRKSAAELASRLLRDVNVKSAIEAQTSAVQRKLKLTQHRVLRELMALGFADIGQVAEWQGQNVKFKDSAAISRTARRAIKAVKQTDSKDGGSFSLEFHDKIAPLHTLAKYTKLVQGDENADGESDGKGTRSRAEARGDALSAICDETEENTG
jgi:phage terminase small subunit